MNITKKFAGLRRKYYLRSKGRLVINGINGYAPKVNGKLASPGKRRLKRVGTGAGESPGKLQSSPGKNGHDAAAAKKPQKRRSLRGRLTEPIRANKTRQRRRGVNR